MNGTKLSAIAPAGLRSVWVRSNYLLLYRVGIGGRNLAVYWRLPSRVRSSLRGSSRKNYVTIGIIYPALCFHELVLGVGGRRRRGSLAASFNSSWQGYEIAQSHVRDDYLIGAFRQATPSGDDKFTRLVSPCGTRLSDLSGSVSGFLW